MKTSVTYLPASMRMLHIPDGLGTRMSRLVLSLLFLLPGSMAFEQTCMRPPAMSFRLLFHSIPENEF